VKAVVTTPRGRRSLGPSGEPADILETTLLVARSAGERLPGSRRDCGVECGQVGPLPQVDATTMGSTPEGVLAATARSAQPILGGGARYRRRVVDPQVLSARTSPRVASRGGKLASQKMGIHEWSYDNGPSPPTSATRLPHRDKVVAMKDIAPAKVELGMPSSVALVRARCRMRHQTLFTHPLGIECDACVDICPMDASL